MPDNEPTTAKTERLTAARHAIAAEVRAEIGRQGKTGRELAELTGLGRDGTAARLRGDMPFRAEELVLIADVLGVSAEQFVPASVGAA
jgi:transcriptional regulator with XRE-family HTH domain